MIAILATTWTVEILGFSRWIRSKESSTTRSTLWQLLGFYVGSAPKKKGTTRSALWKFLDFEVGLVLKE